MTSPTAIQHGRYYHIFNRGNNRENIFSEARNYHYFLHKYEQYISPIAFTFAYCLLGNHFHLMVQVKPKDILNEPVKSKQPGQVFGNFFNAYAKAFNKMYNRSGSLFANPFGRVEVTSDAYFHRLIVYIHQNPQRHGFVDDFRDWPYSSYHAYAAKNNTCLSREEGLTWFGDLREFESAHMQTIPESQVAGYAPDEFD